MATANYNILTKFLLNWLNKLILCKIELSNFARFITELFNTY